MSLDLSSVGVVTAPHELEYDHRTLALYALGIGAKADELDYLYEGRGPKVYPTFAVVPAYAPLMTLIGKTGGNPATMVHGAQTIRVDAPIPSAGKFVTTARIAGIYDMKLLAQVLCETESRIDGVVVCRTEWQLLFRDEGGFGGPRPPKSAAPKVPDGQAPVFEHEEAISPEQALLYRLSGDLNPLHADPEFAKSVGFAQGPILHGLATFGFLARAVIRRACDGDAARLKSFTAQFRKPVWPGETLRTVGWSLPSAGEGNAGSQIVVKAYAGGRDDAVVTGCYADVV
jgi:acyl dehydratase